ncbi:MAG: CDP-diacylglycerol--glycerol-3-phosphate 3-phosphatidyltransferase [Claussenomyces sp. TS43310]|nr:MAG: CDP-diacylglycerol--glycerol-3-phosphate 3-phosphatidyltransferase [Claussenomyces sp. TS43310]
MFCYQETGLLQDAPSTLTSELDKIAPRFEIDGSQVHIIESPTEFYLTLKSKIQNAERRIFLSTLYIGRTEHELIFLLQQALRRQPKLRLNILTDALRGTRESPESSCASLLAPLVAEFGSERVDIRLYHTPNLTGFRKHYIPQRINEGWGLQHMKLYGIDDDIIISGANLSHDYFTNRQDRYHLFSSSAITEYFWNIQHAVSTLSFVLSPDAQGEAGYVLTWPASNTAPSPLLDPTNYIKHATALLEPIIKAPPKVTSLKTNTSVYPLSQLTQLLMPNTSTELPAIKTILKTLSFAAMTDSAWTFTAGYFNPDPSLTQLLVNAKSLHGTVVTASPRANGFYGSTGVSGMLPSAYTLYSRRFLERIHEAGRGNAIILKEWQKGTTGEPGGWTYHAKGLWITMPKGMGPSLTLIGSSNYTKRSYSLDLEANALIVTQDEDLQRRLGKEQNMLQNSATVVGLDDLAKIDRRVSLRVRIAIWIVGILGGAL